ncbi:unnamed protein product [Fusarium graminearum]|nr:unnamed protein product [Fusarium graminearum]
MELPPDDNNSYFTIAGYHGLPEPQYCYHGVVLFPTWHRAYLCRLEDALRTAPGCEDLALPYWDEASNETKEEGIPRIFTDKEKLAKTPSQKDIKQSDTHTLVWSVTNLRTEPDFTTRHWMTRKQTRWPRYSIRMLFAGCISRNSRTTKRNGFRLAKKTITSTVLKLPTTRYSPIPRRRRGTTRRIEASRQFLQSSPSSNHTTLFTLL